MKTILIIIAAMVLVGGGIYWLSDRQSVTVPENEEMVNEEAPQGKIDINAVCEGALAYMSFESGEAAAKFVSECKEGGHPEVIERYKSDMGLGDGAAI